MAIYYFTQIGHVMQERPFVLKYLIRNETNRKILPNFHNSICLRQFRVCEATLENNCLLAFHTKLLSPISVNALAPPIKGEVKMCSVLQ